VHRDDYSNASIILVEKLQKDVGRWGRIKVKMRWILGTQIIVVSG
jgi:hypothetical protein